RHVDLHLAVVNRDDVLARNEEPALVEEPAVVDRQADEDVARLIDQHFVYFPAAVLALGADHRHPALDVVVAAFAHRRSSTHGQLAELYPPIPRAETRPFGHPVGLSLKWLTGLRDRVRLGLGAE